MAIEIVDLPIRNLKTVIFHSYVSLPEGIRPYLYHYECG